MTKKDYIILSRVFRSFNASDDEISQRILIRDIVDRLCVELSTQNYRFNKDKFIIACGINK